MYMPPLAQKGNGLLFRGWGRTFYIFGRFFGLFSDGVIMLYNYLVYVIRLFLLVFFMNSYKSITNVFNLVVFYFNTVSILYYWFISVAPLFNRDYII